MILRNDVVLYHGSYTIVRHPDLSKCRGEKDFGRGFYLTTSHEQAQRFVKSSVGKAIPRGLVPKGAREGYVSKFVFHDLPEKDLRIYEFPAADPEWLSCIVAHRQPDFHPAEQNQWKQYDVLAGKIANDNTNPVILAYMSGLYGQVGSEGAMAQAIQLLLPFRLKNQVCFRTEKSLGTLTFIGSEAVSWQTE